MPEDLKKAYKTIEKDPFPDTAGIWFGEGKKRQEIIFKKVKWAIPDKETGKLVEKGLRYGENPGQPATLYKPINMNIVFGEVTYAHSGELVGSMELLQSGKHPGKINITDADSALNILKYFSETPTVSIIKHNNPSGVACGVASAEKLEDAYQKSFNSDVIAAFGGVIGLNRPLDKDTAEEIMKRYYEVVVAPGYEEGVMDILSKRKNLRVLEIKNIKRLEEFKTRPYLDFKSLMDGCFIVQQSYISTIKTKEDLKFAELEHKEHGYIKSERVLSDKEYQDAIFGWHVLEGVTSNSSLFAKDSRTIAIATGENDRVGGIKIAVKKAYEKRANYLALKRHNELYDALDAQQKKSIDVIVEEEKAELPDSILATDGFMPNKDNIWSVKDYGIAGIIQPGGSIVDYDIIKEANKYGISMLFTGQRCFRH